MIAPAGEGGKCGCTVGQGEGSIFGERNEVKGKAKKVKIESATMATPSSYLADRGSSKMIFA